MTAIKQVAITTSKHATNLGKYLNDERALAKASQNLANEDKWESEMARTRAAYGHDKPSRIGTTNTIMYHQILAFNPDECSCNGGSMTEQRCMQYAQEYISNRYPDQEALWVLHKEHCAADNTERFAIHIGINRTNLETGNRLNEGRSKNAKIERANAVRDMDRTYKLSQMREGERNSRVHARQPSKAEREMISRGVRSDKSYMREAIKASVDEVNRQPHVANKPRELAKSLETKGVTMTVAKSGKDFSFERKSTGTKSRGYKLGRGYSMAGIAKGLGIQTAKFLVHSVEEELGR